MVEINKEHRHNATNVIKDIEILYPLGNHRYLVKKDNLDNNSPYYKLTSRKLFTHAPNMNKTSKSDNVIIYSLNFPNILKDMEFDHKRVYWESYIPSNYVNNKRNIKKDRVVIFNVNNEEIKKLYEHKDTIWIDLIKTHYVNNKKAFEVVLLGQPAIVNSLTSNDLLFSSKHNDLSDIIITIGDTGLDSNHCFFHSKYVSNHYTFYGENGDMIVKQIKANTLKNEKIYGYISMKVPYGRTSLHSDFNDVKNGHGTHVSGTALGGIVTECKKGSEASKQSFSNLAVFFMDLLNKDNYSQSRNGLVIPPVLTPLMQISYESGSRAFSNSWGSANARYSAYGMEMDDFIYKHDDYNIIMANGNEGMGDIVSSVGSPANAKNVIAVGATMNAYSSFKSLNPLFFENRVNPVDMDHVSANPMQYNFNNLAGFSSRGPTHDGRIKPDVVAPGEFILSSRSHGYDSSDLLYMRGTSMATPLVARCVGVILNRFYKTYNNHNPSAALVKNILITSATTLTGSIQNFYIDGKTNKARAHQSKHKVGIMDQGFGRVNLYPFLHNELAFKDRVEIHEFDKPYTLAYKTKKAEKEISIGMVYTDPASFPGSNHILINKIKFKVIVWDSIEAVMANKPPDNIYYPNNLKKPDFINNVQRIRFAYLPKNAYIRIVIVANEGIFPRKTQKISLVINNSLEPINVFHECTMYDFKYYTSYKMVKRCNPSTLKYAQKAKTEDGKCYQHNDLNKICDFETGTYTIPPPEEKFKKHNVRYLHEIDKEIKKKKQKIHPVTAILLVFAIFVPIVTFANIIRKNEFILSNIDKNRKIYINAKNN